MSRGTLDPAQLSLISPTCLSHSLDGFPTPFGYQFKSYMQSSTPMSFLTLVWPLARSLATTCAISFDFSSSPYLDVSVQVVPLIYLFYSVYDNWTLLQLSFLIQISLDHRLFASPQGFSQLITSFFGSRCQGIRPALFLA